MESMQDNQHRMSGEKASGLYEGVQSRSSTHTEGEKKRARADRKADRGDGLGGRKNNVWRRWIVDIVLLLAIAGLIVGAVFGYRALKRVYAPQWEERNVEFCIRIRGVDVGSIYDENGHSLFEGCTVWHTDRLDGESLGQVVEVEAPPEESGHTATLYLTVRGTALYREGEGYYVGETRLLAGVESSFRVQGMTSVGDVIFLREVQ